MASTLIKTKVIRSYFCGFRVFLKQFSLKGSCHFRSLSILNNPLALRPFSLKTFQQSSVLKVDANTIVLPKYTEKRFYSKAKKTSKESKKNMKAEEVSETTGEDEEDDEEQVVVLKELRNKTGLEQGHSVLVIQPDFKWGRNRFHLETVDHMLGEAWGLVESIKDWRVIEGRTEPIRKPDARYFFGKGKLEELTKHVNELKVEGKGNLSAVFLDVGRLTRRQHVELEELWGVKVFDRFSLVLQIFKERAVTREAKVQVELAELGYIR